MAWAKPRPGCSRLRVRRSSSPTSWAMTRGAGCRCDPRRRGRGDLSQNRRDQRSRMVRPDCQDADDLRPARHPGEQCRDFGELGRHPDGVDGWHRIIAVNQTSVFLGTKLAAEQMAKTGGGSIVNISSIMGFVGSTSGHPAYQGDTNSSNPDGYRVTDTSCPRKKLIPALSRSLLDGRRYWKRLPFDPTL